VARQKNDFAQVDAIAEGRVWAGSEAVKKTCGQNGWARTLRLQKYNTKLSEYNKR
jgi:hypothetical protein